MFTHCLHIIHPPTPFHRLAVANPPPSLVRTWSTLLFSDFVGEKEKGRKKNMTFQLAWDKGKYTEFPCISMYICIRTPVDLSPLISFILPQSSSLRFQPVLV
jgi:hypothetical protein